MAAKKSETKTGNEQAQLKSAGQEAASKPAKGGARKVAASKPGQDGAAKAAKKKK